jgi:hypothetical protein
MITITYRMNPAEDAIIAGADLADGMLVRPEGTLTVDDADIARAAEPRRVTRLVRCADSGYNDGAVIEFIGEWPDGYQEVHRYAVTAYWIVRRDSLPGAS